MKLTNRETSLLRALAGRGGRKRFRGYCRCEGVRAVREALSRASERVIFVAATERGLASFGAEIDEAKVRICSEDEFTSLAATVNTQGIMALLETPEDADGAIEGDFVIVFDRLNDPGNCGAIARTCFAAGGREIWRIAGSVDQWSDKALRAGLGAQFALKWRTFADLQSAKDFAESNGYGRFFVADPHEGEVCFSTPDLYDKSLIVIGNEANGVQNAPADSRRVIIPMPGDFESLNAAQAATVLLVEYVRRSIKK
jgi:TrmH family RNA methyltransferase